MKSCIGKNVYERIGNVAYALACQCRGNGDIIDWIVATRNIEPGCPSLKLTTNLYWRSLDLSLAKEIRNMVYKAGKEATTIKDNIEFLRKQAIKEKRVIGGRELLVCIITTLGQKVRRKSINDLVNLQTPNVRDIEVFFSSWRNIIIESRTSMKSRKCLSRN